MKARMWSVVISILLKRQLTARAGHQLIHERNIRDYCRFPCLRWGKVVMDNRYFISECYDLETLLRVAVGIKVYTCVYVCMYECMHAFMYVCMYVCMYVYVHVCIVYVYAWIVGLCIYLCNRNRNLQAAKAPLKSVVQGTSLFTSAEWMHVYMYVTYIRMCINMYASVFERTSIKPIV